MSLFSSLWRIWKIRRSEEGLFNTKKYRKRDAVYFDELKTVFQWGNRYRPRSEKFEYAALVYSVSVYGDQVFYLGKTFRGMAGHGLISPNVVIPFIYLFTVEALKERLKYQAKVAAFVHTHPKPPPGFTTRFHSKADRWLLRLPTLRAVYVIPYENEEINREPHV